MGAKAELGIGMANGDVIHLQCERVELADDASLRAFEPAKAPTAVSTFTTSGDLFPVGLLLAVIACLVRQLVRWHRDDDESVASSTRNTEPLLTGGTVSGARCVAIDAFRGTTIGLMIFVNYGGGGFASFQHSVWDGLTVADVLFPWFAWIMGFTMFLSQHRGSKQVQRPMIVSVVALRAMKLFLLGLFLNNGKSWSHWRTPGVLQSLGLAYFIVSTLAACVDCVRLPAGGYALWHILLGVAPLIALNLAVTFLLPVPGCPRGYLGPGGDADGGMHRNCTGGAHLYVDRLVFGDKHIYETPTCRAFYHTGSFDPEGLLNWLMVAATSYVGFLSGALYTSSSSHPNSSRSTTAFMRVASALTIASIMVGGELGLARSPWIPLNKNLWSLSYVLLSAALASVTFATHLACVTRPQSIWSGYPCTQVGRNSILLYVMHEVMQSYAPFSAKPNVDDATPSQVVIALNNVAGVVMWVTVAVWLHRQRIFITV